MSAADRRLPPGWTSLDATTTAGFIYVAVWREFPDVTQVEFNCAMQAPLGSPASLAGLEVARAKSSLAGNAVATVRARREARRERADLSDDHWLPCLQLIWPSLPTEQRLSAQDILAAVAILLPAPSRAEYQTRPDIVAAAADWDGNWPPTQEAIAEVRGISSRRIRQVQGPRGWDGIVSDALAGRPARLRR